MRMRTGFWNSLESFTTPAAVLAEWRQSMGREFGNARAFLRPMQSQAEFYPCTNRPGCGLRHEVRELDGSHDLLAVLRDEFVSCPAIRLQPHDVVNHELDAGILIGAIRKAFRFDLVAPGGMRESSRTHQVGRFGVSQSPVVLIIVPDESSFLKEFEGLCVSIPVPFILLTPTPAHCTTTVERVLRRHGCAYVPLSEHLVLGDNVQFKVEKPIVGILADFERRLAQGIGLEKTVERIDRNLEAVAKVQYDLRKENEDLKRLAAEGYLKFVVRVEGQDFMAFALIMALGTRKAASDHLKIPHRSFYDRVEKWTTKGQDYQRMYRLVEWRKSVDRKITVPLGDMLQSGEPSETPENPQTIDDVVEKIAQDDPDSREDLLRQILGALKDQNAKNWQSVGQELIELIQEEIPQ